MSEIIKLKLTITPAEIVKILKNHEKCLGQNPAFPIVENILISIEPEQIKFVTTDLATYIRTVIPMPNLQQGVVLVPFGKLINLLKLLSDQHLDLTINLENFRLKIKAKEGNYEIAGENPDDFPAFPKSDNASEWFSASGIAFKNALDTVLYAVCKDELRPAMTGVFVEANQNVTLTATNGNVLAHSEIVEEFEVHSSKSEIMRLKALRAVLGIIPEEKKITISSNDSMQWVQMGDVELCARKIEERYPTWKNAIPSLTNSVKIDRENLLASVHRMLLFVDESTSVLKVEINLKSISISADNLNYDHHGHERVTLESEAKEMLTIGLNASYLKEALGKITQEFLTLEYVAANKAIVLRHESGFCLLMPITLFDF